MRLTIPDASNLPDPHETPMSEERGQFVNCGLLILHARQLPVNTPSSNTTLWSDQCISLRQCYEGESMASGVRWGPKPGGFRDLGRKPSSSRSRSPTDVMTLTSINSAENQEGISFL